MRRERSVSICRPLLLSCTILLLYYTSALILPLGPPGTGFPIPPRLSSLNNNDLSITRNIASELRALTASSQIQYKDAKLRSVYMSTLNPRPESYPLPQHSNLSHFHFLVLNLSAGGPAPPPSPSGQQQRDWIYLSNKFPQNWDAWNEPRIHAYGLPESSYPLEIRWAAVSARMDVYHALGLMRAAGYRDTFAVVFLVDPWGTGELMWGFDYYGGSENGLVLVDVLSGEVTFRRGGGEEHPRALAMMRVPPLGL